MQPARRSACIQLAFASLRLAGHLAMLTVMLKAETPFRLRRSRAAKAKAYSTCQLHGAQHAYVCMLRSRGVVYDRPPVPSPIEPYAMNGGVYTQVSIDRAARSHAFASSVSGVLAGISLGRGPRPRSADVRGSS